ncbi:MAG: ATP-binding protein [Flammeovirgaceae bacterium]
MSMRVIHTILLLISMNFLTLGQQKFNVTYYDQKDGLEGKRYSSTVQDPLGFIWVTSNKGLFRFDGKKAQQYHDGYFTHLLLRKDGSICASSHIGIFSIVSMPDTAIVTEIYPINNPPGTPPPNLYEDSRNTLWILNHEVILKEAKEGFKEYHLKKVPHVGFSMVEDDYQHLWMASSQGSIIYRYSRREDLFRKITILPQVGSINCLFNAGEGRIWMGGATLYELKIDRRLTTLQLKKIVTPESPINFIAEGPMSNLFIGTEGEGLQQLFLRDTINELVEVKDYTFPHSVFDLQFESVKDIHVGHDDDLWLTTENGLAHLHQNFFGGVEVLPRTYIHTMGKEREDFIYASTGKSLYRIYNDRRHNLTVDSLPLPQKDMFISAVSGYDNIIWMGTSKGELFYLRDDRYSRRISIRENDSYILNTFADSKGNAWVFQSPKPEAYVGVAQVNPDLEVTYFNENHDLVSRLTCATEDIDGNIYFGSRGSKSYLFIYIEDENRFVNLSATLSFTPEETLEVHDLTVDAIGDIWLATSDGVLKYDPQNSTIHRVSLGGDPTYGEIRAIESLADSSIWIATEVYGLIKYKNGDFATFDASSGLGSRLFNYRTMLVDNEGFIWVGASGGLEISQMPFPTPQPTNKPMVESVMAGLQDLPFNLKNKYRVPSDTRVSFKFNALSFPPEDIHYQTRILEIDSSWTLIDEGHDLVINQLSEGNYTLQARCKQRGGHVWSKPQVIELHVDTIWYKTWMAYSIYFILLIFAVYGAIKLNAKRLQHRNEQLEQLITERTKEITFQKEEIAAQHNELEKANTRLNQLNNEKNYYIGVVAHDLKSPLNQIKALLQLIQLESNEMPETVQQYLDMIGNSIEHQRTLISDILDLQAIENQKIDFHPEHIDLANFVSEILKGFEASALEKSIQLHFKNECNPQATIYADKHYYQQVIDNLVSNALKFSPNNRNVYVTLSQHDQDLRFSVKDEGPGLSDEDKKQLFHKFAKLSARPTGGEKSNGLGLSIVKQFVESMGGAVWCESVWGKGATFMVQFPSSESGTSNSEANNQPEVIITD